MIRIERSFESFSRGRQLVQDIQKMILEHNTTYPTNTVINQNIERLREEYDLTYTEWYYWSTIASRGSHV